MQENSYNNNQSEEIDLGDLFKLIKRGFNKIGELFLMLIVFLKRNAIILISLIVVGAALGYFLQSSSKKYNESSVTIHSFYESQDYIYKSVNELNWEIKNRHEILAEEFNINADTLKMISVRIKPLERVTSLSDEEKEYITLLKEEGAYSQEDLMQIVLRSSELHKIKIKHPEGFDITHFFEAFRKRLLENKSYAEIHQTEIKNIKESIKSNRESIRQIDTILKSYNANLNQKNLGNSTFYSSENNLNVGEILSEKKELRYSISRLEEKLTVQKDFISPIDEPKTAEFEEPTLSKEIITIPVLLIFLYLGIRFVIYLNRKAKHYENER
ncbi:MAG: copper transporter family protein [Psychroflexus halocasei]